MANKGRKFYPGDELSGAEWTKIVAEIAQSPLRVKDSQLLEALPLERLIELDAALRSSRYYYSEWAHLRPTSIAGCGRELVALASCHPNGYVREAALRAFSGSPEFLPFVIVRLPDWVAAVRSTAAELFRAQLDLLDAEAIVACLALFERVKRWERFREEYSTWLDEALRRPSAIEALRRGACSVTPAVRLRCCRLLPVLEGVASGLRDRDVAVRRWAFGAGVAVMPKDELMRRAAADSHVSIRRLAFTEELSKEQLRVFLFDRAGSIRGEAQVRFGPEAVDAYREALRCGGVSAAAVIGIGETGHRADRDWVLPLLGHVRVRVRRAAVRTVARFGCEGSEELLLRMVERDRPSVACEAASVLLRARAIGAERVWRAATRHPTGGVARRVLLRMHLAGKWERLAVYLEAAASNERDVAVALLRSWTATFNRSGIGPTAEEITRAEACFVMARERMPNELAAEIAFTLR